MYVYVFAGYYSCEHLVLTPHTHFSGTTFLCSINSSSCTARPTTRTIYRSMHPIDPSSASSELKQRVPHTHYRQSRCFVHGHSRCEKLTPRRGIVAHLGIRGCCVHIHTENLSVNTTEGNSRASRESGCVHIHTENRSDNTTEGNSRASRESGLLCSHSHGESIASQVRYRDVRQVPQAARQDVRLQGALLERLVRLRLAQAGQLHDGLRAFA